MHRTREHPAAHRAEENHDPDTCIPGTCIALNRSVCVLSSEQTVSCTQLRQYTQLSVGLAP